MLVAPDHRRPLFLITGLLAGLGWLAAGWGIADPSIYRPTTPARLIPGAVGQDLFTVWACTGLVLCLGAIRRGAEWPWLFWVGLTGYLLYAYGLYSFEGTYNPLFLVYVALLGLSLWGLILFFGRARLAVIQPAPGRPPPRRLVATLFLLLVVLFLVLWLATLLPAMAERARPEGNTIFVFDLSFFLPLLLLEAVLLLRRRPLGDQLAVPILVKLTTLGSSVLLGALLVPVFGGDPVPGEVATYAVMGLLPASLVVPYLRRIRVTDPGEGPAGQRHG